MKVVHNYCFGGFGISTAAANRLKELGVEAIEEYKLGDETYFYLLKRLHNAL